jgi:hypothetical protein
MAVARWLRRALVGCRLPKALRGKYGCKLSVYLDTAYERATSDFYQLNIKPALLSSRFLIVVATPDATRRPGGMEDWIEREIRDFTSSRGGNIIAVRGAGEFDGPLPGDLKRLFPSIEIIDLRGAGRFWSPSFPRIARLSAEKLKIVAPLYNIPPEEMPKLRQEEERRQQTQFGAIVGATLGILVAVSGLSVYSLVSRHQAIRAHDESMFAAGSMIDEATTLDTSDADTARTRQLIISRGCDLLDQADQGTSGDPPIGAIVTCRLERGAGHENLHEDAEARKQFKEAIDLANLSQQRRGRIDAAFAVVQARQAYAEYLVRQKDSDGSGRAYAELLQDAQRLGKEHDRPAQFARFEGEARGQIGDRQAASNDRQGAAKSYDAAATAVKQWIEAVKAELRTVDPQAVAWLVRLYRLAGLQHVEVKNSDIAIERFKPALDARAFDEAKQPTPLIEYEAALVYDNIFRVERERGNTDAAGAAKQGLLKSIDFIIHADDATPEVKQRADSLKRSIEQWER